MNFQIRGLDSQPFAPLFDLSDDNLAALGARRMKVEEDNMYPCRISVNWAAKGEDILLVNHVHQPTASSPYRASGPIFIGRGATGHYRGELAPILRDRLLSLRAYDEGAFILDAEVGENASALAAIARFLDNPKVRHVDAHFARRGCFAARLERI